jgi:hypothetical protein
VPDNKDPHLTSNRLMIIALLLYLGLAFAYGMMTTIQETGLAGQIVALQFAIDGWASVKITMMLTFVVFCLPLIPISMLVKKLFPEAANSFGPYAASLNKFPNPVPWSLVLGSTATLLVLGLLISAVLFGFDKYEENLPVHQMQMTTAPTASDPRSGFIELTGRAVPKYGATYTDGSSVEVFMPVVEQGWTPAAPIRYLAHYETTKLSDGPPDMPIAFTSKTPSLFTGKLTGHMPVPIAREYTDKGLKLAAGYAVIEWEDLSDHHPTVSYVNSYIVAGISVFIAGLTFLILAGAKFANARVLATR